MDVNEDTRSKLAQLKPKVVINTCGPFQLANYKIVESCIEAGVNYIDLADGRQLINGMHKFNEKAVKE
jgi:short subunit dehydrogenase-like uncharacterized protein